MSPAGTPETINGSAGHRGQIEEPVVSKRILIVGATGTVGRALVQQIAGRHEIVPVGRTRGDHQVDITDSVSIRALLDKVGKVDAIVSVTGDLHFGPLDEMTTEQFRVGLNSKLLGQVALALEDAGADRERVDVHFGLREIADGRGPAADRLDVQILD